MRRYSAAVLVLILCCFFACNKSSDDGVFIRVKNNTTQEFKEMLTKALNTIFTNGLNNIAITLLLCQKIACG